MRDPWVQEGSTTFHFINDGIESALSKAKLSANGKDIRIQGGANTIQQFLNAGLIDEFFIHIAPVFLGSGIRLFDGIDKDKYELNGQANTVIQRDGLPLTLGIHVGILSDSNRVLAIDAQGLRMALVVARRPLCRPS